MLWDTLKNLYFMKLPLYLGWGIGIFSRWVGTFSRGLELASVVWPAIVSKKYTLTNRRVYLMTFELHYERFSGCTLNFSLGGAIVVFFLDWGCNCSVAPLATSLPQVRPVRSCHNYAFCPNYAPSFSTTTPQLYFVRLPSFPNACMN